MKKLFLGIVSFLSILQVDAQSRPKLVVGLVIDQMRWDFLYRYYNRYGTGGFKRLMGEGFNCEQTFINYTPTYTAAGHASVYTGSVPALNGIMGNSWYDKEQKKTVYCTDDSSVQGVGAINAAGKMSPRNLWSSTITDELRLATNFRNKTIAISLKDRGAIIPGGHTANAAYWYDNASGGWISSTFYMNELPGWVKLFNDKKLPDQYLGKDWNTLYPINTYLQSTKDSNNYESKLTGEDFTFPHITSTLKNKYEAFRYVPASNTYLVDMALAAIDGEQLGRSGFTDFLALSFSTPDYAGHSFGPNSIELEDIYLRLDQDLARLLQQLDLKLGKGQYLLFLTADHGAAHNPQFLKDNRLPAGTFEESKTKSILNDSLQKRFNSRNLIASFINYQVYLNDSIIQQQGIDRGQLKQYIINYYRKQPAVAAVVDLAGLPLTPLPQKLKTMMTNGFNHRLSGDIQIIFKPQWFESWRTGTTHGLWNPYDAHIPLIFFGWKVKPGTSNREIYMEDIAPTLGALLKIQMPNACVGRVIEEVVK